MAGPPWELGFMGQALLHNWIWTTNKITAFRYLHNFKQSWHWLFNFLIKRKFREYRWKYKIRCSALSLLESLGLSLQRRFSTDYIGQIVIYSHEFTTKRQKAVILSRPKNKLDSIVHVDAPISGSDAIRGAPWCHRIEGISNHVLVIWRFWKTGQTRAVSKKPDISMDQSMDQSLDQSLD